MFRVLQVPVSTKRHKTLHAVWLVYIITSHRNISIFLQDHYHAALSITFWLSAYFLYWLLWWRRIIQIVGCAVWITSDWFGLQILLMLLHWWLGLCPIEEHWYDRSLCGHSAYSQTDTSHCTTNSGTAANSTTNLRRTGEDLQPFY